MAKKKMKTVCVVLAAVLVVGILVLCVKSQGSSNVSADSGNGYTKAAVLSGSLADMWIDAGGTVECTTQDAIANHDIDLPDDVVNAGSVAHPNAEKVIDSGAKLVILSGEIPGQKKLAQTFRNAGLTVMVMNIESFDDYLKGLKQFTKMTGRNDLYKKNGTDVEKEIRETIADAHGKKAKEVLLLRAFSRGVSAKNSTDSMTGAMLKDLGCINIADSDKSLLEDLSMEKIIKADPDYIFIVPMGDSDEAMAEVNKKLASNPAWKSLTAVKNDKVIDLPKELFQLKPNAKWNKSYKMLEDILYGNE